MSTISRTYGQRRVASASVRVDAVLLAVVALTVLGGVARFLWLGRQGFWFDEANTALLAHFGLSGMLGLLPHTESTPPLYYGAAWLWARGFGFHEAGLRALSATAGTATIPLLYAVAASLGSRRAGIVLAALAACNPLLVWYSQEARAYALLVLLSALSLLAWARVVARPTGRRVALWTLAAALALATHYYAALVIVPEAAWLLLARRRHRAVALGVAAVAACGLALVPLALTQDASGHSTWITRIPFGRRAGQVVPQFLTGFGLPGGSLLGPLAVALAALAVARLAWPADGVRAFSAAGTVERRIGRDAALLLLGGVAIELVLLAAGVDDLLSRNLLALWPLAALLVAAGLVTLPRAAAVAATAALCGIGLAGVAGVAFDRNRQRPDWRVVARAVGALPPPGSDRLILVQHYRDLLPLSLYIPGLRKDTAADPRIAVLDVIAFSDPPSGGYCWWGSACNLWPSRLQARYPIPGLQPEWIRRRRQFTILQLDARRPVPVTRREVWRAVRLTRPGADELLLQRP